jgi:hypothetical protein
VLRWRGSAADASLVHDAHEPLLGSAATVARSLRSSCVAAAGRVGECAVAVHCWLAAAARAHAPDLQAGRGAAHARRAPLFFTCSIFLSFCARLLRIVLSLNGLRTRRATAPAEFAPVAAERATATAEFATTPAGSATVPAESPQRAWQGVGHAHASGNGGQRCTLIGFGTSACSIIFTTASWNAIASASCGEGGRGR